MAYQGSLDERWKTALHGFCEPADMCGNYWKGDRSGVFSSITGKVIRDGKRSRGQMREGREIHTLPFPQFDGPGLIRHFQAHQVCKHVATAYVVMATHAGELVWSDWRESDHGFATKYLGEMRKYSGTKLNHPSLEAERLAFDACREGEGDMA